MLHVRFFICVFGILSSYLNLGKLCGLLRQPFARVGRRFHLKRRGMVIAVRLLCVLRMLYLVLQSCTRMGLVSIIFIVIYLIIRLVVIWFVCIKAKSI